MLEQDFPSKASLREVAFFVAIIKVGLSGYQYDGIQSFSVILEGLQPARQEPPAALDPYLSAASAISAPIITGWCSM